MLLLQIVLYYLLFFLLVKGAARNSGLNCLYFYSKPTWKRRRNGGFADKDAVMKKGKRFVVPFGLALPIAQIAVLMGKV